MKRKKSNAGRSTRLSLKFKVFLYFVIFTVVMLALLWVTQTVFLDRFYHYIKVNEVKKTAQTVENSIDGGDFVETIDELCMKNQICIEVADSAFQTVSQGSYEICYSAGFSGDCCVHNERMLKHKYTAMTQAKTDGAPVFTETSGSTRFPDTQTLPDDTQSDDKPKTFGDIPKDTGSLLEYVAYFTDGAGDGYYLIINSRISPVNATEQTLRFQLTLASGLFLLIALFLAWFLSRYISRPIAKITGSARKLATGDYEADFTGEGYREIAQLGDSLHHAASELSKVDKLKNELIANISHDLRTPLTMITGYAEVMRDLPGENTPENVQIIIDESNRLTTLVNSVLDLSKLQSGAADFAPEPMDLTALTGRLIGRCQKLVAADGYTIRFQYAEHLSVSADSAKLQQVLYNLIGNAISYTGEDQAILVRQSRCGKENEWVRIEVIDTGCGISKENLESIWDRYYKENKTHKRPVVGTGLGLSIVKSVLELHRARYGVISDESPQHHGSDFWFELPILPESTTE